MRKIFTTLVFMGVAWMGWAHADTSNIDLDPGLKVGQAANLQGSVRFEKRHTVIPLGGFCETMTTCPQSKTYWSVVLFSNADQFEIDQRFDEGSLREPESVQLGGQTIRPGSIVKLSATVEYASEGYYIVGDIRNVSPVMDYQADAANPSLMSLPNWSCRGNLDRETEIQVSVWYTGMQGSPTVNRYGLRLLGAEESSGGRHTYSLAQMNNVQAHNDRDALVYEGQDINSSVSLNVAQGAGAPDHDVAAKLNFSLAKLPADATKIPAQTQLDVVCNRIR
jgi:hypothetical protein